MKEVFDSKTGLRNIDFSGGVDFSVLVTVEDSVAFKLNISEEYAKVALDRLQRYSTQIDSIMSFFVTVSSNKDVGVIVEDNSIAINYYNLPLHDSEKEELLEIAEYACMQQNGMGLDASLAQTKTLSHKVEVYFYNMGAMGLAIDNIEYSMPCSTAVPYTALLTGLDDKTANWLLENNIATKTLLTTNEGAMWVFNPDMLLRLNPENTLSYEREADITPKTRNEYKARYEYWKGFDGNKNRTNKNRENEIYK